MKSSRDIFVIVICIALPMTFFAQSGSRTRFDEVNKRPEHAEQKHDWAEAEKIAAEAFDIASLDIGPKTQEAAHARFVLSLMQKQVGKIAESNESLAVARQIIEALPESQQADLVSIYSEFGFQNYNTGKLAIAKKYYLLALEKANQTLGERSAESYLPLINLANIALAEKDYSTVNQYHVKAYFVALEKLGADSDALEKLRRSRICFDVESHLSKKEVNAFYDIERQSPKFQRLHLGVINGNVKSLEKPQYPLIMKQYHAGGRVVVQVLIDETGIVKDVDFVCGNESFADNALKAARKSKFTPTMLNDKPIMVSGYITYNFVP